MTRSNVVSSRHLTIITGSSTSISSTIYSISCKISKKANPPRKVCPYDIRKHNVLKIISRFDQWKIIETFGIVALLANLANL